MSRTFKKRALIKHDGKEYQAICVDDDVAVFGEVRGDERYVSHEEMFVVHQVELAGFEYELILEGTDEIR